MELLKRTKRKLLLIGAIACICGALLAGLFYYFSTLLDEVGTFSATIEQSKQDEGQLLLVKKTLEDIEGNKNSLDALFVTADNEVDLIKAIEELASTTKVDLDITSLRHDAGPPKTHFEYVAIQGNVIGNLSNVYRFIHVFGRFPKALEVKQLQFEALPLDEKSKTRQWRGTFSARSLKTK